MGCEQTRKIIARVCDPWKAAAGIFQYNFAIPKTNISVEFSREIGNCDDFINYAFSEEMAWLDHQRKPTKQVLIPKYIENYSIGCLYARRSPVCNSLRA
jgi:hypothetical protein